MTIKVESSRIHIATLPNPYRDALLDQCPTRLLDVRVPDVATAIAGIGHSVILREGYSFWAKVYSHYACGTSLPPYPSKWKNVPVTHIGKVREDLNRNFLHGMSPSAGYCDSCGEYIPWVSVAGSDKVFCSDCHVGYRGKSKRSCNSGQVEQSNIQYNGSNFFSGEW